MYNKPFDVLLTSTHFFIYCQIFTMEDDIVGLFIDIEFDCDLSWKWKIESSKIINAASDK